MITMKEPPPPLLRRKKPISSVTAATNHAHHQPKKLKLVCSFNGAFRPQPPSGAVRYVGGETRIVSVDRNFAFSKLHSKITDLVPGIASFVIRYQLPDSGTSSGAAPILLLDSDDDFRLMVDAFEKLECCGKSARLRLFVCSTSHVNGVGSGHRVGSETRTRVDDEKETKNNNEPLRKMVLRQQLMAAKSGSGSGRGLGDMELCGFGAKKCEAYEPLLIDLDPECDNVARFSAARSNALNPRDGNVRVDQALGKVLCNGRNVADQLGLAMQGLKPGCNGFDVKKNVDMEMNEIGSRNRENIMHWGANCSLVQDGLIGDSVVDAGDSVCGGLGSSIRNHRSGGNEARRQRYIPYCVRNHRINIAEMGKCRTVRLNGRVLTRKCCIGVRPRMSIGKQGRAVSISSNNGSNDIQGTCNGGTCSVNVSLRNLSLSKEVEGPQVKESQGVAIEPSFQTSAKIETKSEHVDEDREDTVTSLCFTEEANHGDSLNCLKVNGETSNDLAAFYTHLATRELQTIKNSDLEFIKELGSGTYGTVYHGKWKGSNVAIKKIKPSCFTDGVLEDKLLADFWKEAHILGQLHHPNIVAFYGVVTDGPLTNLATVTEYMVNGSLQQVLRRKDRTIDRRKRLILAMDAAFGMEYLHEKSIVHFDLKSHNFLVNMKDPQRPVCKIGDLGLSKIKQRTLISGGVRGTVPWMAPELLISSSKNNLVTEKVDVYSFGIVMWELLTGEEPYANLRSEEIIVGIIKGNLRPEIPSWCDPTWRSLMKRCWSPDPKSRPPFSEISKELRAMSAAMNIN